MLQAREARWLRSRCACAGASSCSGCARPAQDRLARLRHTPAPGRRRARHHGPRSRRGRAQRKARAAVVRTIVRSPLRQASRGRHRRRSSKARPPPRFRTRPHALRVRIAPQHPGAPHRPPCRKARGTRSARSPASRRTVLLATPGLRDLGPEHRRPYRAHGGPRSRRLSGTSDDAEPRLVRADWEPAQQCARLTRHEQKRAPPLIDRLQTATSAWRRGSRHRARAGFRDSARACGQRRRRICCCAAGAGADTSSR